MGQLVEVLLLDEHLHRRVVDEEEARQRVELVRRFDLGDRALADLDAVALGQLQLQGRLQRPSRCTWSSAFGKPMTNSRVGVSGAPMVR